MRPENRRHIPELLNVILGKSFDEINSSRASLTPIRRKVADLTGYYSQYEAPVLDELYAVIREAYAKIDQRTSHRINLTDQDRHRLQSTSGITILNLSPHDQIDCSKEIEGYRHIASEITIGEEYFLGILDIIQNDKQSIFIKGHFPGNPKFITVRPLTSLTNLVRMYEILKEMPDSRLLKKIREAQVSSWPALPSISRETEEISRLSGLNEQQKHVARSFPIAPEGIYLLSGPPGTGKTTTLRDTLQELISHNETVLVCAPSNKAIQILAARVREKMPYTPMLLVGMVSKIPAELEDIFQDRWMERYPQKLRIILQEIRISADFLKKPSGEISQFIEKIPPKSLEILKLLQACLRYVPNVSARKCPKFLETIKIQLNNYFEMLDEIQITENPLQNLEQANKIYDWLYKKIIEEIINQKLIKNSKDLLKGTKILFCTLSTSGRFSLRKECAEKEFTSIIVDEAGQALELETLLPARLATTAKKLLLAGDTQQLSPTTISRSSNKNHFDWSMMWRLKEENLTNSYLLRVQYRMRRFIAIYPSARYYQEKLINDPSIETQICHSPHWIPKDGSKTWLDIRGKEERNEKSYCNKAEARSILYALQAIRARDIKSSIGIISFYSGQVKVIKELIIGQKTRHPTLNFDDITVNTVDGFQGGEKDIILISCVRTQGFGFLRDHRRLNVAITRAKQALLIFGHGENFSKSDGDEIEINVLFKFCSDAKWVETLGDFMKKLGFRLPAEEKLSPMPQPTIHAQPPNTATGFSQAAFFARRREEESQRASNNPSLRQGNQR